jgi:predicted lysophospholipase L1 biosynthesis ABC-type transport system permease subunit
VTRSTAPPPGSTALDLNPHGVILCTQLDGTPVMGHCPPGATAVKVPLDVVNGGLLGKVWPASTLTPSQISHLPTIAVTVATNGTAAAIERARTVLNREPVSRFSASTINEVDVQSRRQAQQYQQLAEVVILASLPIAGCSLAVSVGGGLAERRRPFSLLRLSGVPLSALRRVVLWESVAPLLVAAIVAVLAGFATADLFLRAQLGYSLQAPHPEYYVVLGGGLLAALAILATMLPLLQRITGPEVARNG